MKKPTHAFKNEAEERRHWQNPDSAAGLDWSQAERVVLPKLKPSTQTISIRLPKSLLDHLRVLANQRDVPYQSLAKVYLADRVEAEMAGRKVSP